MKDYLKYFLTSDSSENYKITLIPFVGYLSDINEVLWCNKDWYEIKLKQVIRRNDVIIYTASEKLTETTSGSGLHTNAFGVSMTSHTFSNGTGTITFDGDVTNIGSSAFSGCYGLTSVTIPSSVTSIGYAAFSYCSGLTSITIPSSVTSIGRSAFQGCTGLTAVHISDLASWCGIAFSTTTTNPLFYARHLFLNNQEITDLVIPSSVTSIGDCVFSGGKGISSVTIHSSVTNIGGHSFQSTGITSITIPSSVTSIGDYAFYKCSGLTSVTCEAATPPTLGSYNVLSNVQHVYVPAESVSAYKAATNWSQYGDKITAILS